MAINSNATRKKMVEIIRRRVKPVLVKDAKTRFKNAKTELIGDIEMHPVSQEIQSRGFLFAFIGFDYNSNPIGDLMTIYESNTTLDLGGIHKSGKYMNVYIRIPADSFVASMTKLDWTDTPWTLLVENGIPGIQYFLRTSGKGRSLGGIQISSPVPSAKGSEGMTGRDYMNKIIDKFKTNVRKRGKP